MAYQETKTRLVNALHSRGIEVPQQPTGQLGRYLLRAEPDLSKWSDKKAVFQPKSGQWGTWGVFMGDNFSCLMYPEVGIYWVFDPKTIAAVWLDVHSPEFKRLIDAFAAELRVSSSSIGGYVNSEREIYQTRPVYDSLTGIATVERPIPTSLAATAILMLADKVEIK